MADVSDSQIDDAYTKVRQDNGDINWLLLTYENNKKIVFHSSGSGGVNELASKLTDDNCYFGYARVSIKDDETSRTKFAFITYKGESAPVMRKGNVSVHIANVKTKIKDFAVQINASEISEVSEDAVVAKIKAANY
eukprot:TRINITY_DN80_c0_g1_i1.p1 TRINITY_DN80_c0_g1~~TRINITY_DN80_c0_g1_i1.p1  ORF type:complete len:136 (-),score=42.80 TRINITY_DN80_c0_g1_i1:50-457(-)